MLARYLSLFAAAALTACTAATDPAPDPARDFERVEATAAVAAPEPGASSDAARAAHGKYLVELLGCGGCHTDGALVGEANFDHRLAGSRVGIAHSDPLRVKRPGVVFPPNLTPDAETGIGRLTDAELAASIRAGIGHDGYSTLKVMPVATYARLTPEDALAIVAYLRSLEPVRHQVPRAVPEGTRTDQRYVHFGVYRNRKD